MQTHNVRGFTAHVIYLFIAPPHNYFYLFPFFPLCSSISSLSIPFPIDVFPGHKNLAEYCHAVYVKLSQMRKCNRTQLYADVCHFRRACKHGVGCQELYLALHLSNIYFIDAKRVETKNETALLCLCAHLRAMYIRKPSLTFSPALPLTPPSRLSVSSTTTLRRSLSFSSLFPFI